MTIKTVLLIFVLCFLFVACGSDSPTEPNKPDEEQETNQNVIPDGYGYLLDSPVGGLRYKSGAHYGVTDPDGRFGYIEGKNIEFYIGNSLIGLADTAKDLLTPYEFSSLSPFSTLDILRLLQSLDDDGDPTNGITIIEELHKLAETVELKPVFTTGFPLSGIDPDVVFELTSVTTAGARNVVAAYDAYSHFSDTLDGLIGALTEEIQALASQTNCTSSDQCMVTVLETQYTFYCPPPGPSIVYSSYDIDQHQNQFDALVAEREYLIDAKLDVKNATGTRDNTTGSCTRIDPVTYLICNASNHCEQTTELQ